MQCHLSQWSASEILISYVSDGFLQPWWGRQFWRQPSFQGGFRDQTTSAGKKASAPPQLPPRRMIRLNQCHKRASGAARMRIHSPITPARLPDPSSVLSRSLALNIFHFTVPNGMPKAVAIS